MSKTRSLDQCRLERGRSILGHQQFNRKAADRRYAKLQKSLANLAAAQADKLQSSRDRRDVDTLPNSIDPYIKN
jgi:hypothetical protein